MHNIIDFGAVGDGVTVNTQAIQRAIDAGGTVLIPEGVFVTGTLYLKSHGGLHLAPGAVLRASTDRADYNAADYCPQNAIFEVCSRSLCSVRADDLHGAVPAGFRGQCHLGRILSDRLLYGLYLLLYSAQCADS